MKKVQRASPFTQTMVWALMLTTFATGCFPQEGNAALAPATSAAPSGQDRAEDLQKVQRLLESKIVQQRLEDLGLTPEEIQARLTLLSDAQVHQMAAQIDALMPGGGVDLTTIVALVLLLLIVILVAALV